ncbi:serine hydrolase [Mucilaginibacter terrigena]|uniref:Serine hydrolase n=1 Tax=Mucilaginibacter terrigena TaxID=2492395 RepID=A0A4Q5LSX4_9SPHI|nr:serine hydrolase [Mucilaginibacter terrigena]RYU92493.1 serine hydrolase [Mucilaginibacter terrigena]
MKIKAALTAILAICIFTAGYPQVPYKARLDQFFDRLAEKNKAMGGLVIAQNGDIVYSRSIGYSHINGTEKRPLTASTRYRIGSVTKMFTATLIFQLIEEGKLKPDDKLDRFFPQIPNAGKITIEQILAHRSGIHEVTEDQNFKSRRFMVTTKDEMLGFIASTTPDFEPGTKYNYSSAGYFVLGCIIEKITGKTYAEALKKRISDKIGLKDTYLGIGKIDPAKNESYSYKYGRDWEQQPETNMSILFGSGAMVSTTADMAKFIKALFDLKLVSQASLKQITQKELGIATFKYNGKTLYGHTGGIDGFGAWLVYLPEEKLALSYATNGKVYSVGDMIDGIFNIYWNKSFTIPAFNSMLISPEILDKYTGVYAVPGAPVKFTVTRDGDKLFVQMNGKTAIPLEATADNRFKIESAGIEVMFDADKKQMIIIRDGRERVLTKEQ